MSQKSYDNSPTLYLIPTPIGNMEDITIRAVNTLKMVDVVFCEDTRVTQNLLNYFEIKNKLISLHDHNEDIVKEKVLSYLQEGKNVALVTDRGTPIISDPGYKTVKYISDNGYNVIGLPGACAFVPALISSSISSEHFTFYGFLSSKETQVKKELQNLKDSEYTLVFYEAPHRIIKTLNFMLEIFGDRYISISREISKLHESVFVGMISDALKNQDEFKGEFVIVVSPSLEESFDENESVVDSINRYICSGLTSMEAIKKVAKERKIPKNEVYKEYHGGDK